MQSSVPIAKVGELDSGREALSRFNAADVVTILMRLR